MPANFRAQSAKKPLPGKVVFLAHIIAAVLLLLAIGCETNEQKSIGGLLVKHQTPVKWEILEEGLSYTRLDYQRKSDGKSIAIAVLRIDPALFSFRLIGNTTIENMEEGWVDRMVEEEDVVAAVNGGYFLEGFEPTGLLVSEGKVLNPWKKGAGSGVFRVEGKKAAIDWSKERDPGWEDDEMAIQSHPLVVEPGGEPGIYANRNRYRERTLVAVDREDHVIILCSFRNMNGHDLSGLDLYEAMEVLMAGEKRGGLSVKAALNLDGGASTAMSVKHPGLDIKIRSINQVANALAVYRR